MKPLYKGRVGVAHTVKRLYKGQVVGAFNCKEVGLVLYTAPEEWTLCLQ